MYRQGVLSAILMICLLAVFGQSVVAQEEDARDDQPKISKPKDSDKAIPTVEEVKPKVFYLKDKDGKLRPVINFSYEEFMRLQKLSTEMQPKKPSYHLSDFKIRAVAKQNEVRCEISIEIKTHVDQWVVVPLAMSNGILDVDSKFTPAGKSFLRRNSKKSGYEAVLDGKAGKTHVLKLSIRFPITKNGQWSTWKFDAPINTKGEKPLALVLPMSQSEVKVFGAYLDKDKGAKINKDGTSEYSILNVGPGMEITWRKKVAEKKQLEANINASYIVEQENIKLDTAINFTNSGVWSKKLRLRVPTGFNLQPQENEEYTAKMAGKQVIEIQIKDSSLQQIKISFLRKRESNQTIYELGKVSLEGAQRQTGMINVAVVGNWRIDWQRREGVSELQDNDELHPTLMKKYFKRFEVFNFPCPLAMQVSPKHTRISVDCNHAVTVMLDRAELVSTFTYKIRGAKASKLSLDMQDWKIEGISPTGIVESDFDELPRNGTIVDIPLSTAISGELTLQVRSSIKIINGGSESVLLVPRPVVVSSKGELQQQLTLTDEAIRIQPANNVGINVITDKCVNLNAQPAELVDSSKWQQQALMFLITSGKEPAKFCAKITELKRFISANVSTQINLSENKTDIRKTVVQQVIDYQCQHQAIEQLLLISNKEILNQPQTEILLDGKLVNKNQISEVSIENIKSGSEKNYHLRIKLLQPKLGAIKLTIRNTTEGSFEDSNQYQKMTVALYLPVCDEIQENKLITQIDDTLYAKIIGNDWVQSDTSLQDSVSTSSDKMTQYLGTDRAKNIEFQLARKPRHTEVQLLWVQTWLGPNDYHLRAVYRFRSDQRVLTIRFPDSIDPNHVSYLLDKKNIRSQVLISPQNGHEVTISRLAMVDGSGISPVARSPGASTETPLSEHVLELRYMMPRASSGKPSFVVPELVSDTHVQRTLWQLVLPSNQHLMGVPSAIQTEYDWSWTGLHWARKARQSQADLEKLTDAENLPPLPENTNQYLLSFPGSLKTMEISTIARWQLVFLASSVVLLVGLSLIYIKKLRHPLVLLGIAVLILLSAVISPAVAVISTQSAILGIMLFMVALILRRWQNKQQSRKRVIRGARSSIVDKPSVTAEAVSSEGGSRATTISGSMNYEASAMDSEL